MEHWRTETIHHAFIECALVFWRVCILQQIHFCWILFFRIGNGTESQRIGDWITTLQALFYGCDLKSFWNCRRDVAFRHIEHFTIKTMEILLQNCNFLFVFVSVLWSFYTLFNYKIADFYFSTEYPTNTSCPFVYSLWILILQNEMIRTKLHLKSTLVLYSNEAMRSRFYEVFLCFEFTAVFSYPCHNFEIRDCFLYTELQHNTINILEFRPEKMSLSISHLQCGVTWNWNEQTACIN